MDKKTITPFSAPQPNRATREDIQALTAAITALTVMIDSFADAWLNAAYRYGKPADRWRRGA